MELTNENFKKEVLQSDLPVLVDFYASWCGPCQVVSPLIEELGEEYKGKVKVVKLNVDEAQETAGEYSVLSIPTIVLFKNGKIVDKVVGAQPKNVLVSLISKGL